MKNWFQRIPNLVILKDNEWVFRHVIDIGQVLRRVVLCPGGLCRLEAKTPYPLPHIFSCILHPIKQTNKQTNKKTIKF